ncbi:glycerate kinase [Granulicoccus phenolivorans]|uniref:glycerate kinase n=1 Tax=Granulicoccus phenolivorans TaxID=266854 RepID=UPI00041BB376|nr:glycerate kinase [Granulicoccus phenolivorans]
MTAARRVVLAPDSFKGSLTAADACAALAAGWREVDPGAEVITRPMADGGEGTLAAFAAAVPGARAMPVRVPGPDDRIVEASWLLLPDGTGVVELASTSGIELLGERRLPHHAHTRGFGRAIAAALEHGVDRLVLGIGSSASTDGGAGMLRALGARYAGPDGLRGLAGIEVLDTTGLAAPPPGGVRVLSDVTAPLLGPHGAAHLFGPQKGLQVADLTEADAALAHWAEVVGAALPAADPTVPGAGAAGGTGFALQAWGARLVPGAAAVAELIGLPAALAGAALVITGEGSFDAQSGHGKAPALVTSLAARAGVPVALVAGRIAPDADLTPYVAALSLTDLAGGTAAALADPARWLQAAGRALAG